MGALAETSRYFCSQISWAIGEKSSGTVHTKRGVHRAAIWPPQPRYHWLRLLVNNKFHLRSENVLCFLLDGSLPLPP
jgi:hypothetical protein